VSSSRSVSVSSIVGPFLGSLETFVIDVEHIDGNIYFDHVRGEMPLLHLRS
jgi:hypothetical protein